jgi:hypothetical protein
VFSRIFSTNIDDTLARVFKLNALKLRKAGLSSCKWTASAFTYQSWNELKLSEFAHVPQLSMYATLLSELIPHIKVVQCLTNHHAMEAYWGWMYSSTHSLTSALDGGEWSASRPGRFIPRERPSTRWIGGWVGTRAVLDAAVKRKIPSPRRESNPRTPIAQPVAQRYTDWAIIAPLFLVLEIDSPFEIWSFWINLN